MSRGKGRASNAPANPTQEPTVTETPSDEQLQAEVEEQQKLVQDDPYGAHEGMTPNEAIASSVGAPNDYPYVDKSSMPVHERNFSNMNPDHGPSQSDLNPAFTPKPEDGGPSKERDGEGVIEGTEPNAAEQAVAAAENSGQEGAVEAVEESIAEGEKQQMDVDKVNEQGEARAPEGVELGGTLGKAEGDGADTAEPKTS